MAGPRGVRLVPKEYLRVAVAAGGTGGHVFPAAAVAEAVRERRPGSHVLFMGTKRGIDVSDAGDAGETDFMSGAGGASGVKGGGEGRFARCRLSSPRWTGGAAGLPFLGVKVAKAAIEAYRELARFRPHAVLGAGGYGSVAPAFAAKALGAKLILMEQNAIPGRANRLLSHIADEVHTQFAESVPLFPGRARVRLTGNPVRRKVLGAAERRRFRPADGSFALLVMGGSQGARSVNEALWGSLPRLGAAMPTMRVYHCAGRSNEERAKVRLFASGLAGRSWGFCTAMHDLYACADIAVARAGATSIAELAAAGLPAILVPYPHARDDHQRANAAALRRAGACEVVDDAGLDGRTLSELVIGLARDPARRERMSRAMLGFARPGAASFVARRIEALTGFGRTIRIEIGGGGRDEKRDEKRAARLAA